MPSKKPRGKGNSLTKNSKRSQSSKKSKKGRAALKRQEKAREKLRADIASGRIKVPCQATVPDGKGGRRPCLNNAVKSHLTYFDKIKLPFYGEEPVNCCALCGTHWAVLMSKGLAYATKLWYEGKMDWNEYCAMNPNYIDETRKKIEMKKPRY